jgi:hypothetical protein
VAAFFKKNKAFSDDTVCSEAARLAFFKGEKLCRLTNRRLDYYFTRRERIKSLQLRNDVWRAEDIINTVLGEFRDFLEVLPQKIRVTPGATSTRSRRASLPYQKIGIRNLPATPSAQPYLKALASFWGYKKISFETVYHNRVETVPKNWKTDRTIACEPTGNLSLQLALDSYLKERLLKLGVDLSNQSWNQELSKIASISDDYATIDLSMASDTVSFNTVAWLLPRKWFDFANSVRTPRGRGFGDSLHYAKFSSMGNGATFTIESLIFAALCKAAGSKTWAVYGDDLIVPKANCERLLALLRFFGFRVNHEKSFMTGPFRESCGTDWFLGKNVTPFYLRCENSLKTELCHIVNGLASLCHPGGELETLIGDVLVDNNLPLVPWNDSSISGVWVSHSHVYDQRLIRNRNFVPQFKAFVPCTKNRKIHDSRTYFLWHLDALRRSVGEMLLPSRHPLFGRYTTPSVDGDEVGCIIRSSVPIFTHKYQRKWVSWFIPARLSPVYLYDISDYFIRRKADAVG